MGYWTYYSPLGIGFALTLVLHESVWANTTNLPEGAHWPLVAGVGIVVGLLCQLLLIGIQGAFAQVLPVPVGRSIRGRGAVIGGLLIIATLALGAVAGLLRSEELSRTAMIIGGLSLAAAVGALIAYIWCWPMAIRDFDRGRLE